MNMNRSRPGLGLGFALGTNLNAQGPLPISFNTSFTDIGTGLLGGGSQQSGSTSSAGKTTEQLQIEEEGLLRLIDKALTGAGGLAAIFGGEAGAGLFGSSSAKLQTEDLLAKIAGELALVTGKKVTTSEEATTSSSQTESDSIFDSLSGGNESIDKLIQPGVESASGLNLVSLTGDLFSGDLF